MRSVNTSCRDFVPPRPSGCMLIAVAPGADGERRGQPGGVEHRLVERAQLAAPARGPGRHTTSQAPKRQRPGTGSAAGSGGAASRSRRKRTTPYSATARTPPPTSTAPLPPRCGEALDLRASVGAQRNGRAGGLLRQAPQHQAPQRGAARRPGAPPRPPAACPPAPARPSASSTACSRTACSSRSCAAVASTFALRRRVDLAQRREHVEPQPVAGERAVEVRLVLAPREPGRLAVGARVRRASTSSSGRTMRSRRGAIPSRARRPGEETSR